mmetsp:Transcript_1053/g.2219  ORF Transcript_1053/g.2219 Transcript_1053/m.2219 type:complete len:288 (+) Transcript_1053:560-1423(+)
MKTRPPGSLPDESRGHRHGGHGADGIREQEGEGPPPRGDGHGGGEGGSSVPGEAVEYSVEEDGSFGGVGARGRGGGGRRDGGREGLRGGIRIGILIHVAHAGPVLRHHKVPRLLDPQQADDDQTRPDRQLHEGSGVMQEVELLAAPALPQQTRQPHPLLEEEAAHAQEGGGDAVAQAPDGADAGGFVPREAAAAGDEGGEVVGAGDGVEGAGDEAAADGGGQGGEGGEGEGAFAQGGRRGCGCGCGKARASVPVVGLIVVVVVIVVIVVTFVVVFIAVDTGRTRHRL